MDGFVNTDGDQFMQWLASETKCPELKCPTGGIMEITKSLSVEAIKVL